MGVLHIALFFIATLFEAHFAASNNSFNNNVNLFIGISANISLESESLIVQFSTMCNDKNDDNNRKSYQSLTLQSTSLQYTRLQFVHQRFLNGSIIIFMSLNLGEFSKFWRISFPMMQYSRGILVVDQSLNNKSKGEEDTLQQIQKIQPYEQFLPLIIVLLQGVHWAVSCYQISCNLGASTDGTKPITIPLNQSNIIVQLIISSFCSSSPNSYLPGKDKTRSDFMGAEVLVQAGVDVVWENILEKSLQDLSQTIGLATIEERTIRGKYQPAGSRLFFIWAILQKKLNFTSLLLERAVYLLKIKTNLTKTQKMESKIHEDNFALITDFRGLFLCIHCALPYEAKPRFVQGLKLVTTLTNSFQFLYCRSSFEIGRIGMFDIFKNSFKLSVWLILLGFSIFYGLFHRNTAYCLDFWMILIGHHFQKKWSKILQASLAVLLVLHYSFSGMLTTEIVVPTNTDRIQSMAQFFSKGYKIYALNIHEAFDFVSEFPNQFLKFDLTVDSPDSEYNKLFDISENGTKDWPVACVAYFATSHDPKKYDGTKVGSKFAQQNMDGVEYWSNGTAQCHIVDEEFARGIYTFWIRGLHSEIAYQIVLKVLKSGIHNFWEDLYFTGGERYTANLKRNMSLNGILGSSSISKTLSSSWKLFRIVQLHLLLCSSCIIVLVGESLILWFANKRAYISSRGKRHGGK
ncbi:hypothetical protein Fcan01_05415 [Folsomia candida]|uniref:Uncharacterized protein n=1 Tax=Folsomia candida TaxID=158441 RepID=A0A226EVT9_FOLCA|nr:hypothetical protein Fcan01_05415 [Folsomia candida]